MYFNNTQLSTNENAERTRIIIYHTIPYDHTIPYHTIPQWRSQPDCLLLLCQFFQVNGLFKQSISKETNNNTIILTIEIYIAGVKNRAGFATTIPYHTIPYHTIPYVILFQPYYTIPYPYLTLLYHTVPYHTILFYNHSITIPYHIQYHTIP